MTGDGPAGDGAPLRGGAGAFERDFAAVVLASALSLGCVGALCLLIARYYSPDLSGLLREIELKALATAVGFRPEPVERAQFLASLAALPPLLVFFLKYSRRAAAWAAAHFYGFFPAVLLALAGLVYKIAALPRPAVGQEQGAISLLHSPIGTSPGWAVLAAGLSAALLYLSRDRRAATPLKAAYALGAAAIVLFLFRLNLFGPDSYPGSYVHLNPLLYPVSQVFRGNTLLVDLTSQYGLYPEFLNPVFKLAGLSVRSFSAVFSGLTCAAFLCLFAFLWLAVRNKLAALFTFASIFYFGYISPPLQAGYDAFFQYWPVRTLFPCLLCLAAAIFPGSGRLRLPAALLSSAAVYWNLDAGVVCLLASFLHAAYLRAAESGRVAVNDLGRLAGVYAAVFGAVTAAFLGYLYLKSGQGPDLAALFKSQAIFYGAGFYMLPMPALDWWWLVVLVYVAALAYSLHRLLRREATAADSLYLLLALLGFGLFAYYQGRSHDLVLSAVLYPAVLILGLAADGLLSPTARPGFRSFTGLLLLLALSAGFYSLAASAGALRSLRAQVNRQVQPAGMAYVENIGANVRFLKENFSPGETVLILVGNFESVYYVEAGLLNPVKAPSSTEIILKSDEAALRAYLESNSSGKVVCDLVWPGSRDAAALLDRGYCVEKVCRDGTLVILSPGGCARAGAAGLEALSAGALIKFYGKVLEARPAAGEAAYYASVHFGLGQALFKKGKTRRAIEHYRSALRDSPDDLETRLNLGIALVSLGDAAEASAEFGEVLRRKPDSAEAHNDLGFTLYLRGDLENALAHCRKALRLNPRLAEAHNNLGIILYALGERGEAVRSFREALKLRPGYREAGDNLKAAEALAGEHR